MLKNNKSYIKIFAELSDKINYRIKALFLSKNLKICLFKKYIFSGIKKVISRRALSILIVLIYFVQTNALAITSNSGDKSLISDENISSVWTSDLKNYFVSWDKYATQLENNQSLEGKPEGSNVFGLKNQRVDFVVQDQAKGYSLDRGQIEINKPSFSSLKYVSNPKSKEFIIEGITGSDAKGNNGRTVARHVFQGFDVASIVADNLLVIIIEKNGKISVIPKSLIIHYGFEAPIPVFRGVNGTPLKFTNPEAVKSEFLTIGSKPITEAETKLDSIADRSYEAGELVIWEENKEKARANLVKLPMISLLNFVNLGLRYFNLATQLVSFDKAETKELEQLLKEMSLSEQRNEFDKINNSLSEGEQLILGKYSAENIRKSLSNANSLAEAASNPRDKFTLDEWQKEYEAIQIQAQADFKAASEKEKNNTKERAGFTQRLKSFFHKKQVVDPEDFKPNSQNYQQFLEKHISPLSFHKSSTSVFKDNISKILKSKAVTFLMIGAPVLAFYSLPYFYDKSETLKQVESLSYLYEHIIPDVLKDHAYRAPLIISTVIQIAVIPLIYLSAWGFKNVITSLAFMYKDSQSALGLKIKDFALRYKDLTTTQVLLTMNVRFFSMIVTPYWKVAIESLLGQRTFFSSLNKGINPFKRIKKDSEIGKLLNLENNSFVGLHSPLPMGTEKRAQVAGNDKNEDNRSSYFSTYLSGAQKSKEINVKIQEILSEQKVAVEKTAWLLATKALSEKYQLDPASIKIMTEELASNKKVSPEEIEKILSDKNLSAKWKILADELIQHYNKMSAFEIENLKKGISEEQFSELYSKAKEVLEKVSQYSVRKQTFKERYLSFKKGLSNAASWAINLGEKQRKFLQQVVPGKYVAQQVNQDFPADQMMVTAISGTVGDMADINKKNFLMADSSKFLYTSDAQMFNVSTNVYGHLVASAATLSLMFDSITEKKETSYEPREFTQIVNNEWSPSIAKASGSWLKYVSNPYKADIGGLALRRYLNKFNTIFASITFTVFSQVLISGHGFTSAFRSYLIGFFLAHKAYAFPWDFIQAGNRSLGKSAEKNSELIKRLQYQLSQGIKERDSQKSDELIENSITELIELYAKENPTAIKNLILTVNQEISDIELKRTIEALDFKNLSQDALKYLGLFTQLIVAQKTNNKEKYEQAKNGIIQIYSQNDEVNSIELKKLNAQGFLALTQTAPPVPTKENAAITWITSILLGAVLTTVLYTYLAPLLMDPTFLSRPDVVWEALLSCLKFTGIYYLVLGKKPWEFYRQIYLKGKDFLNSDKSIFSLKEFVTFRSRKNSNTDISSNTLSTNLESKSALNRTSINLCLQKYRSL